MVVVLCLGFLFLVLFVLTKIALTIAAEFSVSETDLPKRFDLCLRENQDKIFHVGSAILLAD